jgi:hypothetical protein
MSQLPVDTQQAITEDTGIPFADITDMDWEEIDQRIEQKIGKKLEFHPCNDSRRSPRGSVLLNLGRLIFRKDIENRLEKIK